jgi:hypothetical protein
MRTLWEAPSQEALADSQRQPAAANPPSRWPHSLDQDGSRRVAAWLRPGKLVIMHATIPTYCLFSIEAVPADVPVGPGGVRVVERGSGRVLATQQACMLGGLAILGRRRSAPEAMSTRHLLHLIHPHHFDTRQPRWFFVGSRVLGVVRLSAMVAVLAGLDQPPHRAAVFRCPSGEPHL